MIEKNISPDLMSEAEVQCSDCHLGPQKQIFRSGGSKCLDCHEEDYRELFGEWQSSVEELIRSLKTTLEETKTFELSETEKAQLAKAEQILQKIEFDYKRYTIQAAGTRRKHALKRSGRENEKVHSFYSACNRCASLYQPDPRRS